MRNKLIELRDLVAVDPTNKDIVALYQKARDSIGPKIVMDEILLNNALLLRVKAAEDKVKELESALLEIKTTKRIAKAMGEQWCPAASGMVRIASKALEGK